MRGNRVRTSRHEEEEESVFVSMTDMTIGFLFIVILLLAFFAKQMHSGETVPKTAFDALEQQLNQTKEKLSNAEQQLNETVLMLADVTAERDGLLKENAELKDEIEELLKKIARLEARLARLDQADPIEVYLNRSHEARRNILEKLKAQLEIDFPDLKMVLSEESDALRFQGDGLFRSGAHRLRTDREAFIQAVGNRLHAILPCFTLGELSKWQSECNNGFALIEAVQIEGHTDSDGADLNNLTLSTNRANETFRVISTAEPKITAHLNFKREPVLSVAGYGEMRPLNDNISVDDKSANRRIDLRIIMYTPAQSDDIKTVRDRLMEIGG